MSAGNQQVAKKIADCVANMLASQRILARTQRPINASDILILVQSRVGIVEALLQEFARRKIPTTGLDRLKLKENLAVWDILALLKFICNLRDDMSLACVLASPLIGADYAQITELSANRASNSLFEQIKAVDENIAIKLQYFCDLAQQKPIPSHFLTHILYAQNEMAQFVARLGDSARDILNNLIYQAQNYELANIAPNLLGFVSWVQFSQSEIKRDQDGGGEKLRIMTVHGAKGLEAPIVILADAGKTIAMKESIIAHEQDEICELLVSGQNKTRFGNFKDAHTKLTNEREAEYWRLLYVALTRACDELHIFAHKPAAKSWYAKMKQTLMSMPNIIIHDDQTIEYCLNYGEIEAAQAQTDPLSLLPEFGQPSQLPQPQFQAASKLAAFEIAKHHSQTNENSLPDRIKGNIIHALLERQVNICYGDFLLAVPSILPHIAKNYNVDLQGAQLQEIIRPLQALGEQQKLVELLEEFAMAELPLVGVDEKKPLSAQIDRLIIGESEIHIIDFKTGNNHSESHNYSVQLENYKKLLAQLYPNKAIITSLIYVNDSPEIVSYSSLTL